MHGGRRVGRGGAITPSRPNVNSGVRCVMSNTFVYHMALSDKGATRLLKEICFSTLKKLNVTVSLLQIVEEDSRADCGGEGLFGMPGMADFQRVPCDVAVQSRSL